MKEKVKKIKKELIICINTVDTEEAHMYADKALCDFLIEL